MPGEIEKMKVYGWQGYRQCGCTREICAARSFAAVMRIAGSRFRSDFFNHGETWNAEEIAVASARAGVILWRPIDARRPFSWSERTDAPGGLLS